MNILDVIGGTVLVGGALAMTAITVGPFYFFFVMLPQMEQDAKKARFRELRRKLRKERTKQRRMHQPSAM